MLGGNMAAFYTPVFDRAMVEEERKKINEGKRKKEQRYEPLEQENDFDNSEVS